MSRIRQTRRHCRTALAASAAALMRMATASVGHAADSDPSVDAIQTASPIKHVIIIVGENRSFDHVFATYQPKAKGETVLNLLSEGIVNADGTPGPHFARGHQFQIVAPPNSGRYFISADAAQKQLYPTLPPPDTGGGGLAVTLGPDTRIANVNSLPPGPSQMTGPTMPYDAFTGDTIHQLFQMWQQVDCAVDKEHVSHGNPTGCLHDLQSAVTTTYATAPGGTPHDTGQTMAVFNVQQGDAPVFKRLADQFTMSDNYHQPVMGGTGPDSIPLGFADQVFFSDGNGNPAIPAASRIYNPDPKPGTLNLYQQRAQWFNCSDTTAPGVAAIVDYLNALPYEVSANCDAAHYYPAVNVNPAFNPNGTPTNPANNIPATTMRSIGDALNDKHISWKYYGGGYNASVAGNPVNGYCTICNPFEHQATYPALRADHMRDVTDLFADLANGTLPAVSYVKPDGAMDGHPNSSKLD